eukprot:801251_1
MASQIIYIFILSFVLFNTLKAQTGEGCVFKTCVDKPGQVRINAIHDAHNNFIGGCYCGCDPSLSDPYSPIYCPEPNVVNFNPATQTGDCTCLTPNGEPYHTNPNPNPNSNSNPNTPQQASPSTTSQRLYPDLPVPGPNVPDYGPPDATVEIICPGSNPTTGNPQPCVGTLGHKGDVIILCNAPDACIEQEISCNNDGFACIINCISENACGGSIINGPKHGSLTVNCIGEFSCEGGTTFNGNTGKDLYVNCDSTSACTESIFNMGFGRTIIGCNGDPESCEMAIFNLYPNALKTDGIAFSCMGNFCPINAPKSFSNAYGPVTQTCYKSAADCACPPDTNAKCIINCMGSPDACKDSTINCNNNGNACIINCNGEQSCTGSSIINGPIDGSLTVYCNGDKACEGSSIFNGAQSTDVIIKCNGPGACKGSPTYNFGNGQGALECNGEPDTCRGVPIFNLLPNIENTPGSSFHCVGLLCPINTPPAFNNVQVPPRVVITQNPVIVDPHPTYLQPPQISQNSVNPQIVPQTTASQTVINRLTDHCCIISDIQMTQWNGRCWYYTWESGCLGENGRCEWNVNKCLEQVPICKFAFEKCRYNNECCSGLCHITHAGSIGDCY